MEVFLLSHSFIFSPEVASHAAFLCAELKERLLRRLSGGYSPTNMGGDVRHALWKLYLISDRNVIFSLLFFFCLTQNSIPYFTLDSIFRWIVTKIVGFSWKGGIPNFTPNCTNRPNWLKNSNLCRCKYLYSLHKEVPRISWYYRHATVLLNHALWPTRYNGHFLLHRLKVCTTVCTKDASNGSMD